MIHTIRTIDAHAAGQPLRLVVEGFPRPLGGTMHLKQEWLQRHADHLRRALLCEPRGHADMCGAVLTEPVSPGAHAGVLFMHTDGYTPMCGHGTIAVATIAIERGLVFDAASGESGEQALVLDTPAGIVRTRARVAVHPGRRRVASVSLTNVPSFVHAAGQGVRFRGRELLVDIAFGGAFYAIVDAESLGLPLEAGSVPELRRAAAEIGAAVSGLPSMVHPANPKIAQLDGVIFTGPPRDPAAHLRNVTVFADGASVDRSPCGTGTAAVMAVLDAMALLPADQPFTHESVVGTLFRGRVVRRTEVGGLPAIVPEIEGSAWITGDHTFCIDDDDPLREGFRL